MSVLSDRHPILELENGQPILEKNRHPITHRPTLQTLEKISEHHTFSDLKQSQFCFVSDQQEGTAETDTNAISQIGVLLIH